MFKQNWFSWIWIWLHAQFLNTLNVNWTGILTSADYLPSICDRGHFTTLALHSGPTCFVRRLILTWPKPELPSWQWSTLAVMVIRLQLLRQQWSTDQTQISKWCLWHHSRDVTDVTFETKQNNSVYCNLCPFRNSFSKREQCSDEIIATWKDAQTWPDAGERQQPSSRGWIPKDGRTKAGCGLCKWFTEWENCSCLQKQTKALREYSRSYATSYYYCLYISGGPCFSPLGLQWRHT